MKTVEQLLEEQNDLIRQQNKLLARQAGEASYQSAVMDRQARAQRWDAANPVLKFLFVNPHKR
ncbi:MAG TPA: hypothetical protein VLC51_07305 [Nitrospira sp.]|nr:hypothetical protein [Nitrospira sp.]